MANRPAQPEEAGEYTLRGPVRSVPFQNQQNETVPVLVQTGFRQVQQYCFKTVDLHARTVDLHVRTVEIHVRTVDLRVRTVDLYVRTC